MELKKHKKRILTLAVLAVLLLAGDVRNLEPMDDVVATFSNVSAERSSPGQAMLDVPVLLQYPALPNGCEATSLTAVLHFYGYLGADNIMLAAQYLPHEEITYSPDGMTAFGPDPARAYAGSPMADALGYYCLADPVAQAANAYFGAQGGRFRARNITGATGEQLVRELDAGRPVIVWATLDFEPVSYDTFTWQLPDGSTYEPYADLHCLVLCGYDSDVFYLMDPINGSISVDRDTFMESYAALDSQAVVVLKKRQQ